VVCVVRASYESATGVLASSSTYSAGSRLARAALTIGSRYDRVGIIESSIISARATYTEASCSAPSGPTTVTRSSR
jgi:hypothetical protein